jgi:hypothetical protein
LIFPLLRSTPSATHVDATHSPAAPADACTEASSTAKSVATAIFALSAPSSDDELFVRVSVYVADVEGFTYDGVEAAVKELAVVSAAAPDARTRQAPATANGRRRRWLNTDPFL